MQEHKQNTRSTALLRWLGGIGAFLLVKGKALLTVLKFSKIAGPFLSMLVSIGAYALIYPWSFAVGFVLLLLVHELGHVIAARHKGLPVSAPLFIPFLGALITMKQHPLDARTEAYIAFGGPLLGSFGAALVFAAAYAADSPLLYSLAYIGFLLNLINLLPIHPLDGGRIATAVTRWLWLAGLIGGLAVIVYLKSVLFFIIWALFAYELYNKYIRAPRIRNVRHTLTRGFLIPLSPLLDQGQLIPGPQHRRELEFVTYSNIADRQQFITAHWRALEFEGTIPMPQQSIIHRVHTSFLQQTELENGPYLRMHLEVDYTAHESGSYYEVPFAVRWRYGIGYFALACSLAGLMMLVHIVGNV